MKFQLGKLEDRGENSVTSNKIIISLHKPHPKPIVKIYVIEQIVDHLKEKGKLKND